MTSRRKTGEPEKPTINPEILRAQLKPYIDALVERAKGNPYNSQRADPILTGLFRGVFACAHALALTRGDRWADSELTEVAREMIEEAKRQLAKQ